ncbi:BED zinc finger [Ancylostoma ceylanicum]|uniref:BED zinc finger n=1 Tax=Ancylostoma ceylanicum TaxID=53326 RepID=A0A0D6M3K4_9BILA|nr:BED zinc finger [Ancylostoma ceylanicum]
MNSGEADGPACPVAIHPYGMTSGTLTMSGISSGALQMGPITSTTALGSAVGLPTGLALGNIDITNSWCQFPGYHDIRPIEHGNYDSEIPTINYQDISTTQKYEPLKYDYGDIRTKHYQEQRLYHKEPDRPIKEEEVKFEQQEERCETRDGAAPAKRGRPTENPCWGYFIRLDDQNVRCRLCNKVVKSACATNMTKHLERHHQQDYQQLIVQIKQYRQQKGPVSSGVPTADAHQQSCILSTNQYVKTENYAQQLYNQFDRDDVLRNYSGYDRNDPSVAWQRGQWNQWPSSHDPSTSGLDMSGVLHGCLGSSPNGWSTATPGTSGGAEKPYMKRNRKTEHPVWEYFKRTADGNAQCGICTGVVKSPCSSNFMRHLMRHHSTEYNDVYVKWVQKRGPNK